MGMIAVKLVASSILLIAALCKAYVVWALIVLVSNELCVEGFHHEGCRETSKALVGGVVAGIAVTCLDALVIVYTLFVIVRVKWIPGAAAAGIVSTHTAII